MDTDDVLRLMVEVAEEVINPRFRALASGDVDQKKPGDFVTIADRESEVALTRALRAAYPDALIVGEEAAHADPSLLDAIAGAGHVFVVDPVDGTGNFVHGNPDHAVMIGELRDGVAVRGWIWHPQHQVSWVAERGAGVRRNGEPVVRVSPPGRLVGESSKRRVIGASGPGLSEPVRPSAGSAGIDYPHLVDGTIDFLVFGPPKPWDHVPGGLMVAEMGGVSRFPDARAYEASLTGRAVIIAADEHAFDLVRAALRDVLPA